MVASFCIVGSSIFSGASGNGFLQTLYEQMIFHFAEGFAVLKGFCS
jgi:hypothetical protein